MTLDRKALLAKIDEMMLAAQETQEEKSVPLYAYHQNVGRESALDDLLCWVNAQ